MPTESSSTKMHTTSTVIKKDISGINNEINLDPWNRSPKTDYTYAESIIYNQNLNENFNKYPNMSRLSMHSYGSERYNLRSNQHLNLENTKNSNSSFLNITPSVRKQSTSSNLLHKAINSSDSISTEYFTNNLNLNTQNITMSKLNVINNDEIQDNLLKNKNNINDMHNNVSLSSRETRNSLNRLTNECTSELQQIKYTKELRNRINSNEVIHTDEHRIAQTNDEPHIILENQNTNFFSKLFSSISDFFKPAKKENIVDVTKRRRTETIEHNIRTNVQNLYHWCLYLPLFLVAILFFGWLLWSLLALLASFFTQPTQKYIPIVPVNDTHAYDNTNFISLINTMRSDLTDDMKSFIMEEMKKHIKNFHLPIDKKILVMNENIDSLLISKSKQQAQIDIFNDNLQKLNEDKTKIISSDEINKFVLELTNNDNRQPIVGSNAFIFQTWLAEQSEIQKRILSQIFESQIEKAIAEFDQKFSQRIETTIENLNKSLVLPTAPSEGINSVCTTCAEYATLEEVHDITKNAIGLYDSDKTGKIDYALESAGGTIISVRCTETYKDRPSVISLFGLPIYYHFNGPRTLIQPSVSAGECWAFRGSHGYLVIKLYRKIMIKAISIEHLSKFLTDASSAPKEYLIKGLKNDTDDTGVVLGNCLYDKNGDTIQECALKSNEPYLYVEIEFLSNYGNPEYTCVYRVRIHGEPA